MSEIIREFFTYSTRQPGIDWQQVAREQHCRYLERTCVKIRKSQPEIAIGTCTVKHSTAPVGIVICPQGFLERKQVFIDCLHLLKLHTPGNTLHLVSEITLPGGSVDYFLVSVQDGKVIDFVGIELQAVDTTGSLWSYRNQFLGQPSRDVGSYGMNWKMTAKTTLMQLHHKVETFARFGKHLVLVMQDSLLHYMQTAFNFAHIESAKEIDTMHFHSYTLQAVDSQYRIQLTQRLSTDTAGISHALGLQATPNVELEVMLATLQSKLAAHTHFNPLG